MGTPYLSEIKLFSFNFPPKGWAFCWGQLLPINQNQALFSLLGTTYGGNGQTTFALPDLRGRVPNGWGQGAGLENYDLGQQGGVQAVTLAVSGMPAHTHAVNVTPLNANLGSKNAAGNQRGPAGNVAAIEAAGVTAIYSTAPADAVLGASAIAPAISASNMGGSTPHSNLQPYLVLNYCIALIGIFPSRVA